MYTFEGITNHGRDILEKRALRNSSKWIPLVGIALLVLATFIG